MNERLVDMILLIMPWVIGGLIFYLVFFVAMNFHPGQYVIKTYERVNNRLKEQNAGFFDYYKIKHFLDANGAVFHYGKWITPISYTIMKLFCATLAFSVGIRWTWGIAIGLTILAYMSPEWYLIWANKSDNVKMISQLQTIYVALMVQIRAGVYVTDALSECYRKFKKGRLREAFEEMTVELYINKSFEDVIKHFNEKFSNKYIDSLCMILIQAQETGQAVELLGDMSEQLKDMKTAQLLHKKEALDRTITFCLLVMAAVVMAVIMYAFVTEMYTAVNGF